MVTLPVGSLINERYTVERILGRGGMGVVYQVADSLFPERQVALKAIQLDELVDDKLGLFMAEFKTMTQLSHPNIARIYDFEPMRGTNNYLFTLEYIAGQNILRATQGKTWKEILDLVVQVCRALSYLHSRNVIHFDLKPANVVVDQHGVAKVLDFGTSGAKPASLTKGILGTPAYMAPELVIDQASTDHRYDLYSLGIMLYQLFAREVPFPGTTSIEIIKQHCWNDLDLDKEAFRGLPAWLCGLIRRLCAKSPADRYRSARAVIEEINKVGRLGYEVDTQETRESYVLSSRFVGREHEFEQLLSYIQGRTGTAPHDHEPMLLVGGEAGVGKSRLMREVRYQAQLNLLPFLETNCYEGATSEFAPIASVVEHAMRLLGEAERERLTGHYGAALSRVAPNLVPVRPHEESLGGHGNTGAEERFAVIDSTSALLMEVAEQRPFVLYVNDLQWALSGTIDVLSSLTQRIVQREQTGARVHAAILGSYRDNELAGTPLAHLARTLQEAEQLRTIHLQTLGADGIRSIVCSMLGIDELPNDFMAQLTRETAGNPFFVEEIMRVLVEKGAVFVEGGRWSTDATVHEVHIPALEDVLLERVALLDEAQRFVLETLAVFGRPMERRLLHRVVELGADALHHALTDLTQRRMVRYTPGAQLQYHFAHDRMRQRIYQELANRRRALLHGSIARAIEEIYAADLAPHIYGLADHYSRSCDTDQGYRYCVAAAERAKGSYQHQLGVTFYTKALELLPSLPDALPSQRLVLVEGLADLLLLAGRYDDAIRSYEETAREVADASAKARLQRKISSVLFQQGDLMAAMARCWDAVHLLGRSKPRNRLFFWLLTLQALVTHVLYRLFPRLARLLGRLGNRERQLEVMHTYQRLSYIYYFMQSDDMVLSVAQSCNLADGLGDSPAAAYVYASTSTIYNFIGMYGSATHFAQRSLALAEKLESPWHIGVANTYYAICDFHRGDLEACVEKSTVGRDILLQYGDMLELGIAIDHIHNASRWLGKVRSSLEAAQQGIDLLSRTATKQMLRSMLTDAGWAHAALGDFDKADRLIDEAMAMSERDNDQLTLCVTHRDKGWAFLCRGEHAKATECLLKAREIIERNRVLYVYTADTYILLCRCLLLDAQRGSSEASVGGWTARKLARKGVALGRRFAIHAPVALTNLGVVEWRSGRKEPARQRFALAWQRAEAMQMRWHAADAHAWYARCLLAEDPNGGAEAAEHLRKAFSLFEANEMKPWADSLRPFIKAADTEGERENGAHDSARPPIHEPG